tara:strand:+ start:14094 stop:14237 length:144 start_codon:yes stop_codon:yes gene_type:complete
MELRPEPKSFKLETPIGAIESDSGNHLVDVATVLFVFIIFYLIWKNK